MPNAVPVRPSVPAAADPAPAATVGVGITTRDRWEDLERTLSRVCAYPGLAGCPITVADDGSTRACPEELRARFPGVRFERDEVPRGYIAQRNRLAAAFDTDFYLSLDDDAYPIIGDVTEAVAFLHDRPNTFGLAFNLVPAPEAALPLPLDAAPFSVRLYIGCGHLLDRQKFLALEGYHEEFAFYNEEWDLTARAAGRGWNVLCYPGLVVCHQRSRANRATAPRTFAYARSKTLFALWTLPLTLLPAAVPAAFIGTLRTRGLADWSAALRGVWRGVVDGVAGISRRRPLTWNEYRAWRRLPWPPWC